MKKNRILKVIIIVCIVIFSVNTIEAAYLNTNKSRINKNETITITLDFGEYVAAYDSLEVTFNNNTMEYISGDPLKEGLWWDTTEESTGIKTKTYTFKGTRDGISTITVKVKGAVSANATMDPLGEIEVKKTITIGNGYTKGDLNSDGLVDSADAAIVLNLFKYNNATVDDVTVGDMDGNGMLDSADAAMILNTFKYGI